MAWLTFPVNWLQEVIGLRLIGDALQDGADLLGLVLAEQRAGAQPQA